MVLLRACIDRLHRVVKENNDLAPYNAKSFLKHAATNSHALRVAGQQGGDNVCVPSSILLWIYRACGHLGVPCEVEIPHICKVPDGKGGEDFFIVTKTEWVAYREETKNDERGVRVSDHAKLQYMSRILGIDVDELIKDFPIEFLENDEGEALPNSSRRVHSYGGNTYVMDGDICVTVLSEGMVAV